MTRTTPAFWTTISLGALLLAGCSDGPSLGKVHGQVTLNGEPVPFAYVVFQPIEPKGAYGAAYSDAEGRYELLYTRSRKGALVGKHAVTVRTSSLDEIQVEDKKTGLMVTPKLPKEYRPKLEAQFERQVAAGDNPIDLEIKPGPRSGRGT
jgi:hypothetical protein